MTAEKTNRYNLKLGTWAASIVEVEILDAWEDDPDLLAEDSEWCEDPNTMASLIKKVRKAWWGEGSLHLDLTQAEAEMFASELSDVGNALDEEIQAVQKDRRSTRSPDDLKVLRSLRDAASGLSTQVWKRVFRFRE